MKKYTIEIYERGGDDEPPRLEAHYSDLFALRVYACVCLRKKPGAKKGTYKLMGRGFGEKPGAVTAVAKIILRDKSLQKIVDAYDALAPIAALLEDEGGQDND